MTLFIVNHFHLPLISIYFINYPWAKDIYVRTHQMHHTFYIKNYYYIIRSNVLTLCTHNNTHIKHHVTILLNVIPLQHYYLQEITTFKWIQFSINFLISEIISHNMKRMSLRWKCVFWCLSATIPPSRWCISAGIEWLVAAFVIG